MNESIFEVSRDDYKYFIETIKSETKNIITEKLDDWHEVTKIFSKKTGKCLASRITHIPYEDEAREPEKYYIFELPNDDERMAPIPHMKIVLETKEEVQAFLDGIKKLQNHD